MLRSIIVLMISTFILTPLIASEPIANPTNNPVIGFINKEKFHTKAEEVLDRYLHPEKYKVNENPNNPVLQSDNENTSITNKSIPESEVHAAISPINPDIMVVSPIKQDINNSEGSVLCPVYYSKDRGATWNESAFLTKIYSKDVLIVGGGDPVLVFDKKGDLYFSWINIYFTLKGFVPDSMYAALYWAKSTDGGITFTFDESNYIGEKLFVGKYGANLPGMLDKQWMAVDMSSSDFSNSVYMSCLYLSSNQSQQVLQMHVYHKRDGANQFERKPAIINTSNFRIVQFGSIDVDNKGYIHLTFYGVTDESQQSLYYSYSSDGGITFSNPVKISNLIGSMRDMDFTELIPGISTTRMYPAPYMVVDKSGSLNDGNIYVAWSATGISSGGQNGMEIYFSRSTNNGISWSTPKVINDDKLIGIHNFYSNIAINNKGIIAVTWYDARNYISNLSLSNTDYYIGISYDGGLTFKNHKVSSQPSNFRNIGSVNNNFGIGEYNAIMMTDDFAYPVWGDGRTNDGNINIYMAKVSLDDGTSVIVEDILPINENVKLKSISPNPASNLINVDFSCKSVSYTEIEVTDISGRTMLATGEIQVSLGDNSLQIDVGSLPSGNYFIKILSGDSYSTKLFKIER